MNRVIIHLIPLQVQSPHSRKKWWIVTEQAGSEPAFCCRRSGGCIQPCKTTRDGH